MIKPDFNVLECNINDELYIIDETVNDFKQFCGEVRKHHIIKSHIIYANSQVIKRIELVLIDDITLTTKHVLFERTSSFYEPNIMIYKNKSNAIMYVISRERTKLKKLEENKKNIEEYILTLNEFLIKEV